MESVIPAVPINTAALVAKIEAHTAQQCQLVPWWQGASTSHLPSLVLTSRAGSHHMVREIAAEKYNPLKPFPAGLPSHSFAFFRTLCRSH